jgi:ribosomal protein S25
MADAFEHEIEELVAKVTGELARDIAALILRRLGIENGQAHGWVPPKVGRPRRGRPAANHAEAKPARSAAAGKRRGKRSRASADEMTERVERIVRIVEQSDGVSSSDIEKKAKLPRNVVQAAIRTLREQGRIFMGGTKRFARYATSQKHADAASVAAHG